MSPAVSVLIRTMGRPSLARSVQAALAQTHRPLEIVVVNAAAKPLPALPQTGNVPLRVVEGGPYDRPRAANAALDNASGEWLIFLDDDDAFAPAHVQSLLEALARSGGARVAYSGSAVIELDGKARIMMGAPFNRMQLFSGNYIQIGAALFSRKLLAQGARFDERLDCYEDWDFFIQLAQLTHFVYTALPTNHWFAHAGESGAGMGANQRDEVTRPWREAVVAKWSARSAALHELAQRNPGLVQRIVRGPLPPDAPTVG